MAELQGYLAQLKAWFAYAGFCLGDAPSADICKPFWTIVMIAGLVLALALVFVVSYKLIRNQLDYLRNRKLLEARMRVADPEVMKKHAWAADDFAQSLSQEELAALIRENKGNTRTETT
jgi:hypothetical protein